MASQTNGAAVATTEPDSLPDTAAGRWKRARSTSRHPDADSARSRNHQWLTVEQVTVALLASRGNILMAAERLGCTRQNVYEWIYRTKKLQELQKELQEEEIDEHENALRWLALEELHPTAILSYLNAKARPRGWGRTDSDRAALQVSQDTHLHLHLHGSAAQLGDLSDDDLDRLIAERRNQLESDSDVTTRDSQDLAPLIEIIPPQRKIAGPTEDS